MKIRSRLKHGAAGLLSRFISRNNDYHGFWALGLIYGGVRVEPWRVEFDLISVTACPDNNIAASVAAEQATLLRVALSKQQIAWNTLKSATLTVQFNADVPGGYANFGVGEPFVCTVELETARHTVTISVNGRCAVWKPGVFSGRSGHVFPQL